MTGSAQVIDLAAFSAGTRKLSPAVAHAHAEAAAVCLELEGHVSGVRMVGDVDGVPIIWADLDPRAVDSHGDLQRATEEGAVAIAIIIVKNRYGYDTVRQARKGPGFDWYLQRGTPEDPFDGAACLEVSGLLDDTPEALSHRLRRKLKQIRAGGAGLPGFAVVVGFASPAVRVAEVEP